MSPFQWSSIQRTFFRIRAMEPRIAGWQLVCRQRRPPHDRRETADREVVGRLIGLPLVRTFKLPTFIHAQVTWAMPHKNGIRSLTVPRHASRPASSLKKIEQIQLRDLADGSKSGVGRGLGVHQPAGCCLDIGGSEGVFLLTELHLRVAQVGGLCLRLVEDVAVENALAGNVVEGVAHRAEGRVESAVRLHRCYQAAYRLKHVVSGGNEELRAGFVGGDLVAVADLEAVDDVVAIIADAGRRSGVFYEGGRTGLGPGKQGSPLEGGISERDDLILDALEFSGNRRAVRVRERTVRAFHSECDRALQ